jgi:transposase-like protein
MINYFYDKIKNSIKETYENSINELDLMKKSCPFCKAKGQFKNHGVYERHVIALMDHQVIHEIIMIKRVKCQSCKHTHALIPSFIIPYCTFTYSIILKCLDEKVINKKKILEICETYGISFQLLYDWIKRFNIHYTQSFQVIEKGWLSVKDTLVSILNDLSWFLQRYFEENRYSFMQIIRST